MLFASRLPTIQNMDRRQMLFASRLSTIRTRSLICHANFSQTRPPRRVDYLAPLWECMREVGFPWTQRYMARFRNGTESRQPSDCQLALFIH